MTTTKRRSRTDRAAELAAADQAQADTTTPDPGEVKGAELAAKAAEAAKRTDPAVKVEETTKTLVLHFPRIVVGEGDSAKVYECSHSTWGHSVEASRKACLKHLAAQAGVTLP